MGLSACTWLGKLPYDPDEMPPAPDGGRIRPSVGWLATREDDAANRAPDGSVAIDVVHIDGRTLLQQVRHFRAGGDIWGDSILLERSSLRPVKTIRWTARGTYIAQYNHRIVTRTFIPVHGSPQHSTETLDVEPFSALGFELLVAALPLGDGYHGLLPVTVDTVARGWSWLHFVVQREVELRDRPDQPNRDTWIVDCDIGASRSRLWIAMDGHVVRKIEQLDADNDVLSVVRRMLLRIPERTRHAG